MIGAVAGGQERICVVAALLVVVFHIQRVEFRVVDVKRATRRVDVLAVQGLLRGLSALGVFHLNERLEFLVLCERDYLENGPEAREDRVNGVERHRIEHVLDHGTQDRVGATRLGRSMKLFGQIESRFGHLVVRVARVGHERLVVGVLGEDLSTGHRDRIVCEVIDHCLRLFALFELEKRLQKHTLLIKIFDWILDIRAKEID